MESEAVELELSDSDAPDVKDFGERVLDLAHSMEIKPDVAIYTLLEVIDILELKRQGFEGVIH